MASPSGIKSAIETHSYDQQHRGSLSESSTIYQDVDDEEAVSEIGGVVIERSRPSFLGRVWQAMSLRRRARSNDDYFSPADDGLLKKRRFRHASPRESRRCRRGHLWGCLKKMVLVLPVVVLVGFGILHIVQVLLGQGHFFWDSEDYDEYLPEWGRPGQPGDGLADYPTDATRDVIPIACHSHNDYWRHVPLFDAIHWGCTGVEADVWLFDEELYVGHNTAALTKNRTFRALYVDPLVELLDKMNPSTEFANTTSHGVFDADTSQTLVLLIDFKTNGRETWPYVYDQLSALREKNYLTYWDGTQIHSRAVTIVGTGNTPFDILVSNETHRDIFFDAPLDRFSQPSKRTAVQPSPQGTIGTSTLPPSTFTPSNSYYASVSFTSTIGFVWRGHLSSTQLEKIRAQIRGAHAQGLKVRYWDTPSWPRGLRNHVWHVLMREGVDMLNVDDLKGAAVENWRARVRGGW